MSNDVHNRSFIRLFRASAPYINAFRGRTFVIVFGGEALEDNNFAGLIHDLALLNSLGIRLVLIHGARPQIEQCLTAQTTQSHYVNELRVTDAKALDCVKATTGYIRLEIEARLSMGLANSPMAGARIRVASGNYVIAKPHGIRDGVDFLYTGDVRRIDASSINHQLKEGCIVLLSPVGYSPTGEIFNLSAEDVATAAAKALHADKLIYLTENILLKDSHNDLIKHLDITQCSQLLRENHTLPAALRRILVSAIDVCSHGIQRVHIVNRLVDGALLQELFTRDGTGTLINADTYEGMRQATIDDVGGILELITPLEEDGILVRRSRERLEVEINHFTVIERDGMVIACTALYPFDGASGAELACLAVHPDYRGNGRGDALLGFIESKAKQLQLQQLYVLSTRTSHWFQERGFKQIDTQSLPVERQSMYNFQRQSKVFCKDLN